MLYLFWTATTGEVLVDRLADRQRAQVHQVEMIAAELPQVLLHLAAEVVRPRHPLHHALRVPPGSHLGGDHQAVRVGREGRVDQLVGRTQRGEVERGGIDVVNPERNGPAQHGDRLPAIARRPVPGRITGQPHRPEPKTVDRQIPQPPAASGIRGDHR
jgi:hypothetical protein